MVDASLVIKWLLSEIDSDVALTILEGWIESGTQRFAPFLMPFEVANALHRRVVDGELTTTAGADLLENVLASHIRLRQTGSLHRRALEIATELSQGAVYDAHYLALAEALDCEMWTADSRFYNAANRSAFRVRLVNERIARGQ